MRIILTFLLAVFLTAFSNAQQQLSETVFFEVGCSELSLEAIDRIDALFPLPENMIIEKVAVVGHADKLGDEAGNLRLSAKRAREVYSYMRERHLDMIVYDVDFVGESSPLFHIDQELNRCVTIQIDLLPKLTEEPSLTVVKELFPEEFPEKEIVDDSEHLASVGVGMANKVEESFIPKSVKRRDKFKIENIHFYGNRADYTRSSEKSLKQLLEFMNQYPKVRILLEGHVNGKRVSRRDLRIAAKESGGKFYKNAEELSKGRAQAVKNYLVRNGIDASRIETVGKGGDEMIYPKPRTNAQNEANRRIEIIILDY